MESHCKSCNRNDHSRKSSLLCPNYNPRPSKLKPQISIDDNEYIHTEFGFTIKTGLTSLLTNKVIHGLIDTLCQQLTCIAFQATRLLNLHLLRLLNDEKILPELTDKYIRQFFRIVQKNVDEDFIDFNQDVVDTYVQCFQFDNDLKVKLLPGYTQVLTIFTNSYLVNLDNHINLQYWKNLRLFCQFYFQSSQTNINNCIQFFENLPSREEIIEEYGHRFAIFHNDNLIKSIYLSTIEVNKIKRAKRLVKKFLIQKFKRDSSNGSSLEQRYSNIDLKQQLSMCTIVPLCNMSVKNITIDTDVLYNLMGRKKGTNLTLQEFANEENQLDMWKHTFKLKDKWLELDSKKKSFNYQILTDGVGCSLIFKKFRVVKKKTNQVGKQEETKKESSFEKNISKSKLAREKKELKKQQYTEQKKEEKNENKEFEKHPMLSDKTVYIGFDPGASSVLTTVTQIPFSSIEITKGFSSKEYHHRCHHKQRLQYNKNHLKHLENWMTNTPTKQTMSSYCFMKYLNHVNMKEFCNSLQKFHFRWKTRLKKWNEYIQQQKTLHSICEEIISTVPKENTCVIAFGDASWTQGKGYESSPRGKKFYNYLKTNYEDHKRILVFSTPEFNTSQICSKCNLHERIKACKKPAIAKPHFVRECKTCSTIWNRDINACRNIITVAKGLLERGYKPEIFSNYIRVI